VEVPPSEIHDETVQTRLGLHQSQRVVLRLSALFALDAFAGGFVMTSFIAFWFSQQYGVDPAVLGAIIFGANVLAAISALAAVPLAARFGLMRTMVFTHLPSNVLLMLVPFMPTLAGGALLLRFSISQMDVPTRQSYTVAVVDPDERSAAAGSPASPAWAYASPLIAAPLLVGSAFTGPLRHQWGAHRLRPAALQLPNPPSPEERSEIGRPGSGIMDV
jgi:predicted MFS family arabinose efflux permease